jgi:hypothetical protein
MTLIALLKSNLPLSIKLSRLFFFNLSYVFMVMWTLKFSQDWKFNDCKRCGHNHKKDVGRCSELLHERLKLLREQWICKRCKSSCHCTFYWRVFGHGDDIRRDIGDCDYCKCRKFTICQCKKRQFFNRKGFPSFVLSLIVGYTIMGYTIHPITWQKFCKQ